MKVSELGEFGLIDLLAKIANRTRNNQSHTGQNLLIGIGDDAAALRGDASIQLLTVDSFIQNEHFSLAITPWPEVGWKALAVNLSDIAAMGGVPRYAVVSLALPSDTDVDSITALYQGMAQLAQEFGVVIVGGDTSQAPQVALNITVLGSTGNQNGNMMTRSGAKPGDRIAVSGSLGAASAGLDMLSGKLKFDDKTNARLKQAFLHPYPRVSEGKLLLEQGIKAAIDISDGLVSDLGHICRASQLGARLDIDAVPVDPAVRAGFGARALKLALSGGEDYELLFTASAEVIDNIRKLAKWPITVIGDMAADKENKVTLFDQRGKPFKLDRGGWEHFR